MEVDPERQRDWRRMEQQRDLGDLMSMLRSGFSSNIEEDGAGLGAIEEGEEEAERTPTAITMVFIMPSRGSIMQYLTERSRAIILVSRRRASSGSGDAEATAPDGEEGDDPMPSAEASAGSQHASEEEEADGDPAQWQKSAGRRCAMASSWPEDPDQHGMWCCVLGKKNMDAGAIKV